MLACRFIFLTYRFFIYYGCWVVWSNLFTHKGECVQSEKYHFCSHLIICFSLFNPHQTTTLELLSSIEPHFVLTFCLLRLHTAVPLSGCGIVKIPFGESR